MKTLWTVIALGGFISISLFGVFLMPYDGSDHDTSCLASLINNSESPCPKNDPLGFANFHNNAIKKIATLVPIDAASIAYFSLIVGLIFYSILTSQLAQNNLSQPILVSTSEHNIKSYPLQSNNLRWFSLHENSPSFF